MKWSHLSNSLLHILNRKWLSDFPIKEKKNIMPRSEFMAIFGGHSFFYLEIALPFAVKDPKWEMRQVRQFQQKLDLILVPKTQITQNAQKSKSWGLS